MKNLLMVAAVALLSLAAGALDLASLDKNVADWKAKIADPKAGARDRAAARVKLLDAEAMTGTAADLAAKRAALEDFLTKPIDGMKGRDQLDFIQNLHRLGLEVRLPSRIELAERFVKNLGDGGREFKFRLLAFRLDEMTRSSSLEESMSVEARIRLIDEALADPELRERELWLHRRKFQALGDLGRDAEAEAYALALLATTNRQTRVEFHPLLAAFYENRAERYCSAPDPATLEKAIRHYRAYLALVGQNAYETQRHLHAVALCQRKAGDLADARQTLVEEELAIGKLSENLRKSRTEALAMLRGDLAFDAKDYAAALRAWEPYRESILKTGSWRDVERPLRMCRALSAVGRRADMLPYLELLAKRGNKYTRLRYEYDLQSLKKEFERENQ